MAVLDAHAGSVNKARDRLAPARRLLGPWLGTIGGFEPRGSRFAGRLCEPELSTDELVAIYHSLIFRNGVRKTTEHGRNVDVIDRLIGEGLLALPASIAVLDLGASAGLDALSTYDRLAQVTDVRRYVLGDYFTEILVDCSGGRVFDQDGVLMQRRAGFGFVNRFFSCADLYALVASIPQRLLARLLMPMREKAGTNVRRIQLLHPAVQTTPDGPFVLERLDVFGELPRDTYDLVICLHLLVDRYFPPQEIEAGVRNLQMSLRVGGTLVAGATEKLRMVRRIGDRDFDTVTLNDFV